MKLLQNEVNFLFLVVLVVPNALNLAVYGWGKDAAYLRQYAGKVAKKLLKK